MTRRKAAAGAETTKTPHEIEMESITTGFEYWKARQRGEKPKVYNEMPCQGYYREPIKEKQANGQRKTIGYKPVAIFMGENGLLSARVGPAGAGREVAGDDLNELWTWVAQHDISEAAYDAVARRGEAWPDIHDPSKDKVAVHPLADAVEQLKDFASKAVTGDVFEQPAEVVLEAEIEKAEAGLSQYETIESDEQSSRSISLRGDFLALRKRAEEAYEVANRPLLDQQKILREKWFPLRDKCDVAVKIINAGNGKWEDVKREAKRRADAETKRLADEAAAKHAKEVAEAAKRNAPPPAAPQPAKVVEPNTPAPAAQIRGGGARAASVKVDKFVTDIDTTLAFPIFAKNPEVIELLTALAQKAIRAGVDVPGVKWEERSVVR